jgi:hypothetical protein
VSVSAERVGGVHIALEWIRGRVLWVVLLLAAAVFLRQLWPSRASADSRNGLG